MTAAYIKSKKFKKSKHNRGLAVLSFIVVLVIFSLSFFYLIQTNGLIGCSYRIREHKEKIKELEAESQQLEMEIAQWQSPANLETLVESLKMIEAGQVTYLKAEKEVAVKE